MSDHNHGAPALEVRTEAGVIVSIDYYGKVTLGEGVTEEQATRTLWENVAGLIAEQHVRWHLEQSA